jgi:oxygen-dependent protoporphyrinogen oxidase
MESTAINTVNRPESGRKAAVVGGGWSGIAAAWYLHLDGYQVTLYDQGRTLGGRSASAHLGDRSVTLGGKNIGGKYSLFREFVAALGTDGFENFGINSSRIDNGKLRTVDGGSKLRAVLGFLRRTPPADALRLLRLIRLIRASDDNKFLRGPGFTALARRGGDLPMDGFFGPYLRSQLIRPMTVRMNAAEPDEVFIGSFGTNLGMLMDRFDQLTAGFESTFDAFSALVNTQLRTHVRRILTEDGAAVGIEVLPEGGTVAQHAADVVVVALPSWDAAVLVEPLSTPLADTLREIQYFPAAVAMAEYAHPVFTEQVRALVFPPESPLSNAGAYGVDDRHIVRYTFSGRAARTFLGEDPDAMALVKMGEAELTRYIPVPARTRQHIVAVHWQHGLCAYGRNHDERLSRIDDEVSRLPGLTLTGDYVQGASIEACFRAARDSAAALTHPKAGPDHQMPTAHTQQEHHAGDKRTSP